MRTCTHCGLTKELSEFKPKNDGKRKVPFTSQCKECISLKYNVGKRGKENFIKKAYNLSLADYQDKIIKQNGCCFLCGVKAGLHIDHCHKTKQVRQLLCSSCNLGLGKFKDDPELMEKAASYVRKTQVQ